jgi:hypothetical protein
MGAEAVQMDHHPTGGRNFDVPVSARPLQSLYDQPRPSPDREPQISAAGPGSEMSGWSCPPPRLMAVVFVPSRFPPPNLASPLSLWKESNLL